jgi:hypothetical protein
VLALQTAPLARTLPSHNGSGTLLRDLFSLGSYIESSDFDGKSFVPLFERIDSHASDQEVCAALFAVLARQTSTPPTIFNKLVLDTPFRSTSSSQQANEQAHDDIDERILQEINGCVYTDTEGFYKKYFEGKEWSAETERIAQEANPQVVDGRWTDYPQAPSQNAVLDWFWRFQQRFLQGGRSTYYASPDLPLTGSDCKRKPDLFLAPSQTPKHGRTYHWRDVRVLGELKQSEIRGKYTEELLSFCGHAREVFASQPTRLFLHGFFIRGSGMELWMFDRSGLYSCEKFSIHLDPRRFIKIVASYSLMSDQELGVNTRIKEDKMGKYILFKGDGRQEEECLYLEDKPIALQRAIVCRGTTCYRAKMQDSKRWEYVVKFAWRSDKRQSEGQLLKLAKERKVWGVAELFGHQDLKTIDDLRQGLQFGKPKSFRSARKDSINQSHSRAQGSLLANGLGISLTSASSSGKRKRRDEYIPTSRKRSKSSSRKRSDAGSLVKAQLDRAVGDSEHGPAEPNANSLTALDEDDGQFENRIFSCLVISPPGRAIHEFTSVEELLEACRDVIKGHRSLYYDGKILHRDISENNLIITEIIQEGDPRGKLIDLDLAKELDGGPSGARHRTGTMEFMAIEVLEGRPHTHRHDLESLFYVFLWVIICHLQGPSQGLPKGSQLRGWYRGSYAEIADMKRGHMDKKRFKGILAEFPSIFDGLKSLAEELRDILFPYREGLFTGTYGDPDKLYQPMVEAFERTIVRCRELESGKH